LEVGEESQVGFDEAGGGGRGTSPGELDRIPHFEEVAKETDMTTPSKHGSNGEGKVLLGKMLRPKKEQRIGKTELQNNQQMQGVQCQNRIERSALFWGKREQGAVVPCLLPQSEFQQSVSIDRRGMMKGGWYTIVVTKSIILLKIPVHWRQNNLPLPSQGCNKGALTISVE
jgi:hypothetical protein